MLGIGVWYLGFGTNWIASYRGGKDNSRPTKSTKHLITGVQVDSFLDFYLHQVGLVALSMILTQVTATALQNKKGLAFGNQILGWCVLGTSLLGLA